MTPDQLLVIMPLAKPQLAAFFSPLCAAMQEGAINTPARQIAFLAEIAHESSQLRRLSENLNYSPEGLLATFNTSTITRFTREDADRYGRTAAHPADQPMIANIAYANRMGNGSVDSGDGWQHRGAGLIELTGKVNHLAVALYFDIEIEKVGDWLRTPVGACRSAAWFWKSNGCNELADKDDFDGVCDVINIGRKTKKEGDSIGYAERLAFRNKGKRALA